MHDENPPEADLTPGDPPREHGPEQIEPEPYGLVPEPQPPASPAPPPVHAPPTQPGLIAAPPPGTYRCARCGYDLTGLAIGSSCPECGTRVLYTASPAAGGQSSGKAVTALVLGIVSIVSCFFYGLPSVICGPLAIYFAKQAFVDIQTGAAPPSSHGMAKAGKVCGIVGTVLGGLYLLVGVAYFVFVIVVLAA